MRAHFLPITDSPARSGAAVPLAAQNPNYVDPREEPQHGYTFTERDVDPVLGGNAARILG